MPSYDYKCRACGQDFEKNVEIALRDSVACDCGEESFRVLSFFGSVYSPTKNGGFS